MKRTLFLITVMVCCGGLSAQQTYSLEQILDSALHNNIAMRNARQEIDAAQQQRKEAFTKYFPNVSATGLWFNANKGTAEKTLYPSEMISPEMGAGLAQMFPAEALAALQNPVSLSLMKHGTVAGITAMQPVFAGGQQYRRYGYLLPSLSVSVPKSTPSFDIYHSFSAGTLIFVRDDMVVKFSAVKP